MICECGHKLLSHRFILATRDNGGECLARGCGIESGHGCDGYISEADASCQHAESAS